MVILKEKIQVKWVLVLLISTLTIAIRANDRFKNNSVLRSGSWYKIKVSVSGIYKISYEDLADMGFVAPENIRIYGNGGQQLSFYNEEQPGDDLLEVPLYSSDNSDFGSGDYYLFYGKGVENVEYNEDKGFFEQSINCYSLFTYYYVTSSFGPGKRIKDGPVVSQAANNFSNSYNSYDYIEDEKYNLISSGKNWVGEKFVGSTLKKNFNINELDNPSDLTIESALVVRSSSNTTVDVFVNGAFGTTISFKGVDVNNHEGTYANKQIKRFNLSASSDNVEVLFSYNGDGVEDQVYLDYVTVNARSKLVFSGNSLFFRDIEGVGENTVTEFSISNVPTDVKLWDITEHNDVTSIPGTISGSSLKCKTTTEELREFVAVALSGEFSKPVYDDDNMNDVGWIENQNLHNAEVPELLIVTHPAFLQQAKELADLHRKEDDMTTLVVTTEQVYNEFSSGMHDASAIRNFASMLFNRSSAKDSLKYLLLFGDGSFDNRTYNNNNPKYIPTYQSENSLTVTSSYVTDDFYALLEIGEGGVNGTLDIGVGRLPVNSDGGEEYEAQGIVDKIKEYYNVENKGDWLNRMIFLGDDGESGWDNKVFMEDSDLLTKKILLDAPSMNINKVYLDAYQQISSSTGAAYPEVEKVLASAFNKGALVFNYMGHGGKNGITQEQVLTKTDFTNLSNAPYYPLFITATCQLSNYDNVDISGAQYAKTVSAGEAALLNPNGGAIAMLTTTRLVYQSSNKRLSESVYELLFKKDYKGDKYRIGDVIRIAKNTTTAKLDNTVKFTLLGDPAITLNYGEHKVITDSINRSSVYHNLDTVNALSEVEVTGYIAMDDSSIVSDFNGVVYINAFDKEYEITTNGNDGIPIFNFEMQDRLLYRGKATVKDGRFKIIFKVPKDITYSFGEGKFSYYAKSESVDAKGAFSDFIIGGTSKNPVEDISGPQIRLYMNDTTFIDGGITNASPVLIAKIYDENGINTTGNGIGHDLVGILDDDLSYSYLLNDYFTGELDDYKRGSLSYPMSELEEGPHTIDVKVWDTYNNSSEERIGFYVVGSSGIVINELINYPNPASEYTIFQYRHNKPDLQHVVKLELFDISGNLVHYITHISNEEGFVSQDFQLDFNSVNGSYIEPGVYPYRLRVVVSDGSEGIKTGRLIIIP